MEQPKKGMSRRDFVKSAGIALGGVTAASALAAGYLVKPETVSAETTAEMQAKHGMPESAKPIPPVAPPAKWDFETDVCICGGGLSGLIASCHAMETGAKVITLEKNAMPGGDGQWAEATDNNLKPFTFEEFIKADETLLSPKDGKNHRFQYKMWQRWSELIDYLTGKVGVALAKVEDNPLNLLVAAQEYLKFHPGEGFMFSAPIQLQPAVPVPADHPNDVERWHPHECRGFTQPMYHYAVKKGVDVKLSTPMMALVMDGGRVVGVKAKDNNNGGKEIYVKAKTVVIGTGGLVANRPMFEYYCPPEKLRFISKYAGMCSATGDGQRAAQGAGGFLEEMGEFDIWDGGVDDPAYVNGPRAVYTAAGQLARQKSLSVNKLAKRFTDESRYAGNYYTYNGYQKCYQLDSTSFTLLDANCIKKEDVIAKFDGLACEWLVPWFDQDFERQLKAGIIMKANSIRELAGLMGLDPAKLEETVNRYNALSAKGEDTDMGKDPKYLVPIQTAPFYAIKEVGGTYWHHGGGLVYNESLQIVDTKYQPIPGLYVSGQCGRSNCHVANALGSGYLAGENAAREALGQPVEF